MTKEAIYREDAIETAYQLRHKPNDAEWAEWLKAFNAIPSAEITADDVVNYCRPRLLTVVAKEALPSADRPQGEWIPCSERLPSEDEQDDELGVIVTLGNGYSGLQYDWYHDGYWYDWEGFVVAWMSLPKPWKGASDE